MTSRRKLLKTGAAVGAAAAATPILLRSTSASAVQDYRPVNTVPTLPGSQIPKYVTPYYETPAMPRTRTLPNRIEYDIAVRRFRQQVLPAGFPSTVVQGFGNVNVPGSFHAPARSYESQVFRTDRITYRNQLVDSNNNALNYLLPVDPTIHWFNAPAGNDGRDSMGTFTSTPPPYMGPIPLVVHTHGAHDFEDSDGFAEDWFLPNARNIPANWARVGSKYDRFREEAFHRFGVRADPGSAVFQFDHDQGAQAMWFHDHSLGTTRLNDYMGEVGFYFLRGGAFDAPPGVLPGPAPGVNDPPGTRHYELPMILADKSFNRDGSLFYPTSREFFGDTTGPYVPQTDINPYWVPMHFAQTNTVNGVVWPRLSVEPRRYRFRVLDASTARLFTLKVVADPLAQRPAPAALPIWAIGSDGGFLRRPVAVESIDIGISERLDIVIDFTGLRPGTQLYLINEQDEMPGMPPDPNTAGQIMRFDVVPLTSPDRSVPMDQLTLPAQPTLTTSTNTRKLIMNAQFSTFQPNVLNQAQLGVIDASGTPVPMVWEDPVTENPAVGSQELWELHNLTPLKHMIHVHLVEYQVVNREVIATGEIRPVNPWETGRKDVVFVNPGEITRIINPFDRRGLYLWHCHILDHEDNSMMRPLQIGAPGGEDIP